MVATVAVAAAFACSPQPGLGSITRMRGGKAHVVDLATCRDRVRRHGPAPIPPLRGAIASPNGRYLASVQSSRRSTIRVADNRTGGSHSIYSNKDPILLLGWSGDDRWIFFMIDPGGSASIAADGVTLRVVSARGGRGGALARVLPYRDYLAWCGGRLVFTGGGDRVATHGKRLLVASPPKWRPSPLVDAPGRAWGSLACAPSGHSVVAQSQPRSGKPSLLAPRWSLWQVELHGSVHRLTSPPRGYVDESPRFSRDGRVLAFVRSRNGIGSLYVRRRGRVVGPVLSLGVNLGYYGHRDWWQAVSWSLAR